VLVWLKSGGDLIKQEGTEAVVSMPYFACTAAAKPRGLRSLRENSRRINCEMLDIDTSRSAQFALLASNII
jgi:hypothetical protein